MNFRKKAIKDFFLEHSKVVLLLLGVVITSLVGVLTGIILVYQKGFLYNKMGYAYALSWVLLLIMGIITAIIFKTASYWVFYESEGE